MNVMRGMLPVIVALVAVGASSAVARVEVDFAKPDVSYSAVRVMEAEQNTLRQRFYYVPDKTRSEMDAGGEEVVTITRDDLGLIWVVMGQTMYLETSMSDIEAYAQSTEGSPDAMEIVEYTEVGREPMEGYDTTKYRVRAQDPDGDEVLGHFWVTGERIPVRMEMDFQLESENRQQHIVVRLEDLQVGPQDPALFEVPAGAQKFNAGSLPGFGDVTFQEQLKRSAADSAQQGANEAVRETTRDRVKDGVKRGLKKLFGG